MTLLRQIFIQMSETPNPNFLKFIPSGKTVIEDGTFEVSDIKKSVNSPLAFKLMCIEGVTKVFYAKDYVSVGKQEEKEWEDIRHQVIDVMNGHFSDVNYRAFVKPVSQVSSSDCLRGFP